LRRSRLLGTAGAGLALALIVASVPRVPGISGASFARVEFWQNEWVWTFWWERTGLSWHESCVIGSVNAMMSPARIPANSGSMKRDEASVSPRIQTRAPRRAWAPTGAVSRARR
jgi:hypothetical protein